MIAGQSPALYPDAPVPVLGHLLVPDAPKKYQQQYADKNFFLPFTVTFAFSACFMLRSGQAFAEAVTTPASWPSYSTTVQSVIPIPRRVDVLGEAAARDLYQVGAG
jgi:hypothetical protein